jgi:uncharacterized protein
LPLSVVEAGVRLRVRLTPRAGADRIGAVVIDDAGRAALKVHVTAAPEDGKANAALIELLARSWKLPKSAIAIASGPTARVKTLIIADTRGGLFDRLAARVATTETSRA